MRHLRLTLALLVALVLIAAAGTAAVAAAVYAPDRDELVLAVAGAAALELALIAAVVRLARFLLERRAWKQAPPHLRAIDRALERERRRILRAAFLQLEQTAALEAAALAEGAVVLHVAASEATARSAFDTVAGELRGPEPFAARRVGFGQREVQA